MSALIAQASVSGEYGWLGDVLKVAAGGGIVQALLAYVRSREDSRKTAGEAQSVVVGTMESIVIRLRSELSDAERQLSSLRRQVEFRDREIERLAEQVVEQSSQVAALRAELRVRQAYAEPPPPRRRG